MDMIIKNKIHTSDDAMYFSALYIFSLFMSMLVALLIFMVWPIIILWLIGTGISYYFLRTKTTDTNG